MVDEGVTGFPGVPTIFAILSELETLKDLDQKPTSIGIAIPNTELWIVDEDGNKVGPEIVGELVFRGATVMKGYWEKPEATAEKLKPGPLPGEQVLYTGDYCKLDQDGYLYFIGRMDDVLKCGAKRWLRRRSRPSSSIFPVSRKRP